MATYPGAVKTFTSKADGAGNTINASHINDLQDEVNAIEDGLLNGTAPVNSSRITAASLSVAGGSTFVGVMSLPAVDAARLELAAALAVANNSTTAIAWTVQTLLTNSSMHSTVTAPSQVSFHSTGVYWCQATITWNAANSSQYVLAVEDSSGAIIAYDSYSQTSSVVSGGLTMTAGGLKHVALLGASPWIRVVVRAIGSTNSVDATAGRTQFNVFKAR